MMNAKLFRHPYIRNAAHRPDFLTILSLLLLQACDPKAATEYQVSGRLENTTATVVYLEENALDAAHPVVVDSAVIKKTGSYEMSTIAKDETIYSLRLAGTRFPFVSFVNDSKAITIDADFKKEADPYTIKGSEGSQALKTFLQELGQKINALQNTRYAGDSIGYKRSQRDSIIREVTGRRAAAVADIKQHASGFLSSARSAPLLLYALGSYQSIASNPAFETEPFSDADVQSILSTGAKKFPQHKPLASLAQQLQKRASQLITAPDFTLPDTTGQPLSLRSFKGRYVLVDFWASWCPPCRAENPNVVAAFQQFKDKNFTVLGVSLDKERQPWLNAITEDSLAWTHVSDLKYWNSLVVPLYAIEEIPFNVLLDPHGTILARNLRGQALHQKLQDVLK